MSGAAWGYLLFTVTLGVLFAGIIVHYFRKDRRDKVESPKHRMLEDD